MKLTGEEAQAVVLGDSEDWEVVCRDTVDTSQWSIFKDAVAKHIPSGKFYEFNYSEGATECQDESPYEHEMEVTPVEVVERGGISKKWVKA